MTEQKQYLIYFDPGAEISQKVQELNSKIAKVFQNTYVTYIGDRWVSHLMVYLSPLPTENEKSLISLVTAYAKKIKPFEISLGGFTSEGQDGWVL